MEHVLALLVGWKRINYTLRATQTGRDLGAWVKATVDGMDPGLAFDGYLGTPANYSEYLDHEGFRSVQCFELSLREDFVGAIEGYRQENHAREYEFAVRKSQVGSIDWASLQSFWSWSFGDLCNSVLN